MDANNTLARGGVQIGACCGDRRTKNKVVRRRPLSLVKPRMRVAVRVAARRKFRGPIVGFQRTEVLVSFLIVMMMRQRVRQCGSRVGGHDGES